MKDAVSTRYGPPDVVQIKDVEKPVPKDNEVLNPKGILITVGERSGQGMIGLFARLITALVLSWFVSQKLVTFLARPSKEDLNTMRDLMATGKVTPVIDKRYSLSKVPEALRYLEEGHARGKVVITVEQNNKTY